MRTIALDVHTGKSQLCVADGDGTILLERTVATNAEELRKAVCAVQGPKRVVFESGPLAGLIQDALEGVVEDIIACDPTQNALIAKAEDSNDERDARRLSLLARNGSLQRVYVPSKPFRTLRSLVCYETRLTRLVCEYKLRIKAFFRSQGVAYRGRGIYAVKNREEGLNAFTAGAARFQIESLYRMLDTTRKERVRLRGELRRITKPMPVIERLQSIPGIGPVVARVLVAWIVDPGRFQSRGALCSYAGLALRQNFTNWKATGRAHASKRGQRDVKRVLFLASRAVLRIKTSALAQRYQARREAGWEDRKAIRDVARTLLLMAYHVWKTGEVYDHGRVTVPGSPRAR